MDSISCAAMLRLPLPSCNLRFIALENSRVLSDPFNCKTTFEVKSRAFVHNTEGAYFETISTLLSARMRRNGQGAYASKIAPNKQCRMILRLAPKCSSLRLHLRSGKCKAEFGDLLAAGSTRSPNWVGVLPDLRWPLPRASFISRSCEYRRGIACCYISFSLWSAGVIRGSMWTSLTSPEHLTQRRIHQHYLNRCCGLPVKCLEASRTLISYSAKSFSRPRFLKPL